MRQLVSRHDLYHTIVLWQVCIVSTLEYCVEACNTDTENGHNKIMYIVHNRTTKINKNKFEMETLIKIDHHTLIFFIYILCLLLNIILKHFVENVLFLHDFVTFYLKFNMATTAWQQSDSCQVGTVGRQMSADRERIVFTIVTPSTIQITHHISDESIKRPSSDFKSASLAEEPKPAGTTTALA